MRQGRFALAEGQLGKLTFGDVIVDGEDAEWSAEGITLQGPTGANGYADGAAGVLNDLAFPVARLKKL
jgi:hypothetical protein